MRLALVLPVAALLVAGAVFGYCAMTAKPTSTRWEAAAADAGATVAAKPTAPVAEGGGFNAAFPPDGVDGYKRVFTQEKDGYAEAKLQKDGADVATLSIADTNATPDAKSKFAGATEKLGDAPMMTVGKNQTTVLVKDRYQAKVSSPTLDHAARKTLLAKFDFGKLPR